MRPPRRPTRLAAALLALAAVANASCATTAIMVTDYDQRRPEQYRLLWVDAAVVGGALAVGAPLYGLSEPRSTEETVGAGLLMGASAWAIWNLIFLTLLRMPDSPAPRYVRASR